MRKISDFNSATDKYPVVYAGSATRPEFVDMPTILQQQEGVAPVDTLPAQWWNAMWKLATRDINAFRDYVGDSITEINNLLTKFDITLDAADSEQLYDFFHDNYVQNYLNGIFINKSGGTIDGDLHIKGDLSVDGIGEEIISTELKVGANTITLRNDNPTALGNTELAGVVTKNYDGNNHNNIIAIDKNGEARTGDIDIATRILYSNDGTNFFTDEDLTTPATIGATEEVRDTGNQTSGGVEIYEGITYSNNDTQPLLTRDESNNLTNGHILVWDAINKRAVDGGSIIDRIYPIGSIYQNADNSTDPSDSSMLGAGTWVRITDAFLAARGTTIGASGGAWSKTLTSAEIPQHTHTQQGTFSTISQTNNTTSTESDNHTHSFSIGIAFQDGGPIGAGSAVLYKPEHASDGGWVNAEGASGSSYTIPVAGQPSAPAYRVLSVGGTTGIEGTAHSHQYVHDHNLSISGETGSYGSANPAAISIIPTYVGVVTWKRSA